MWLPGITQAAKVSSPNFIVEAPTQDLAQEFSKLAEHYRKLKAIEWLGYEMPQWPQPCPLQVTPTASGASGATSFYFPDGRQIFALHQTMFIKGPLERLRNSVLPHEVTHTVLAHYFRNPVPRWADEGASVYSEDQLERSRHDDLCRQVLNAGRAMPLRRLFALKEYPQDVMVLYAEGYAISKYLIESKDRKTYLNFVAHGMQAGWEAAVQKYYSYRSVDELEQGWLDHLKKGKKAAPVLVQNDNTYAPAARLTDAVLTVRQNVPPAQPRLDPTPVSRGSSPSVGRDRETFGGQSTAPVDFKPAAQLGEPILTKSKATTSSSAAPSVPSNVSQSASTPPARPEPPSVILFPPEPLPLR
jgi:hypothetical protein